jgi:hypothetical protein
MRLVDWIDRGQDQGESRNSQGIAEPEQAIHGALSVDSSAARRSLIDPELMRQLFEVLCIHDFRTGWACQFSNALLGWGQRAGSCTLGSSRVRVGVNLIEAIGQERDLRPSALLRSNQLRRLTLMICRSRRLVIRRFSGVALSQRYFSGGPSPIPSKPENRCFLRLPSSLNQSVGNLWTAPDKRAD